MTKPSASITAHIVKEVAKCGLKLVTNLTDTWISYLIEAFDDDVTSLIR